VDPVYNEPLTTIHTRRPWVCHSYGGLCLPVPFGAFRVVM